jgi:hypothetical protein
MYLNVPYVTQLGVRKTANDPTGCWQACARMVHGSALSTAGSSTADGTRWDFTKNSNFRLPDGTGVSADGTRWDFTKNSDFVLPDGSAGSTSSGGYWDHQLTIRGDVPPPSDEWLAAFASREKLAALAGGFPQRPDDLALSLRKWGPLIVCWHKGQHGAACHASVVIGVVAKREVIFHDPENAPNSRMNLAAFIGKLAPQRQKGSSGHVMRKHTGGLVLAVGDVTG